MNLRHKIITIVYSTLILSGQLWATTNIPEVDEVKDNKNNYTQVITDINQQMSVIQNLEVQENLKKLRTIPEKLLENEKKQEILSELLKQSKSDKDNNESKFSQNKTESIQWCNPVILPQNDKLTLIENIEIEKKNIKNVSASVNSIMRQTQHPLALELLKTLTNVLDSLETHSDQKASHINQQQEVKKNLSDEIRNTQDKIVKQKEFLENQQQEIKSEIEHANIAITDFQQQIKSSEEKLSTEKYMQKLNSIKEQLQSIYNENESRLSEMAKFTADLEKISN
ncbi:MAG: hypothetical protein ACRYGR_03885 [Janthinobacterium lividum]